ncbi:MAG: putative Alpha/beta hydrolase fold [Gemmatimonadetes bacterium]|nr:putative Alpha/beta hydrolase fold [Gemmatimonadota bacterium]
MPPCKRSHCILVPALLSSARMHSRTIGSLHLETIDVAGARRAPVLCLHGLFAGAWVFERVLPMLAARGYPASALSFRGHPPSPPIAALGRLSIAAYCHDAMEVARTLDRPIIIGHSLGGLVALLLAARHVARAAVLVSPAPPRGISVLSPPLLLRMARYLPAMLLSRPFLPIPSDLDALVLNRVPVEQRGAIRDRMVSDSGRAARQAAFGAFAVPSRGLRTPLLVVAAEHDRFIPAGVAARVAHRYGAPLHLARGHGHFLFGEPGWEAHLSAMIDWMDAIPRAVRDAEGTTRPAENPRSR